MRPQRVRDGAIRMEKQAAKWTAEGAVKGFVIRLSILRRGGIRQLPGIDVYKRQMREKVPVGESFDLLERKLVIGGRDASMFFVDGLVDGGMMQRVIFSLFSLKPEKMEQAADAEQFIASNLPFLDAVVVEDLEKAVTFLYSGLVPLFVSGYSGIIIIDCRSYPLRGIEEPSKEKRCV